MLVVLEIAATSTYVASLHKTSVAYSRVPPAIVYFHKDDSFGSFNAHAVLIHD